VAFLRLKLEPVELRVTAALAQQFVVAARFHHAAFLDHVDAVGIDLTRRDLQIASREVKRPWEIGKAFDGSAPCGAIKPASEIGHPTKGKITLKVNGKVRQDGDLNQMIWNIPETISKLSEMVALAAGDIIMTGTPSGVAATVAGDKIECEVEIVGKLTVTIGPPAK
jgi:fumarylpyruvate hydrolase